MLNIKNICNNFIWCITWKPSTISEVGIWEVTIQGLKFAAGYFVVAFVSCLIIKVCYSPGIYYSKTTRRLEIQSGWGKKWWKHIVILSIWVISITIIGIFLIIYFDIQPFHRDEFTIVNLLFLGVLLLYFAVESVDFIYNLFYDPFDKLVVKK